VGAIHQHRTLTQEPVGNRVWVFLLLGKSLIGRRSLIFGVAALPGVRCAWEGGVS
jgi:hypothetical protein